MANVLIPLCDAVVAELNANQASFSLPFTAARMNVVRHNQQDMSALLVTVTAKSRKSTPITRAKSEYIIEIYVGIEKQMLTEANSESDPLIALGEQLDDYWNNGKQPATFPGASCILTQFGEDGDSAWLSLRNQKEMLVYTGILKLVFKLVQ